MHGDLKAAAESIRRAKCVEDVFGELTGSTEEQRTQLAVLYKRLAVVLHPDRYPDRSEQVLANEVFQKLNSARSEAERKVDQGIYGDRRPTGATPAPSSEPTTVTVRGHKYELDQPFASGDIADLYLTSQDRRQLVLKVARGSQDNDLMQSEASILKSLYPSTAKDERYYRYLVRLEDSFLLRGSRGSDRRVNVLPYLGGYVTLQQVMDAYPDGLDFRDVAWMAKRLLAALGFVHREGFLHGCLNPSHILVHPIGHGAKLVDWCYAVAQPTALDRVKAMSPRYSDYCAPEVLQKLPLCPGTDLYSAAACLVALLGGNPATGALPECVPEPVRNFLRSCLLTSPVRRPDDAWDLHDELDEVLRRLVGRPTYRPLAMPGMA